MTLPTMVLTSVVTADLGFLMLKLEGIFKVQRLQRKVDQDWEGSTVVVSATDQESEIRITGFQCRNLEYKESRWS